jgi:hypothetical protein
VEHLRKDRKSLNLMELPSCCRHLRSTRSQ